VSISELTKAGALLLIFVLACAVCYVWFRYRQVEDFQQSVLASESFSWYSLPEEIATTPPTICQTAKSGFAGADDGTYYFDDGNFRDDSSGVVYGRLQHVHVIIQSTGRAYSWNEDTKQAYTFILNALNNTPLSSVASGIVDPNLFTSLKISCSPWWSPDPNLFSRPLNITFSEIGTSE
jgi:hypothetical protein